MYGTEQQSHARVLGDHVVCTGRIQQVPDSLQRNSYGERRPLPESFVVPDDTETRNQQPGRQECSEHAALGPGAPQDRMDRGVVTRRQSPIEVEWRRRLET